MLLLQSALGRGTAPRRSRWSLPLARALSRKVSPT